MPRPLRLPLLPLLWLLWLLCACTKTTSPTDPNGEKIASYQNLVLAFDRAVVGPA